MPIYRVMRELSGSCFDLRRARDKTFERFYASPIPLVGRDENSL